MDEDDHEQYDSERINLQRKVRVVGNFSDTNLPFRALKLKVIRKFNINANIIYSYMNKEMDDNLDKTNNVPFLFSCAALSDRDRNEQLVITSRGPRTREPSSNQHFGKCVRKLHEYGRAKCEGAKTPRINFQDEDPASKDAGELIKVEFETNFNGRSKWHFCSTDGRAKYLNTSEGSPGSRVMQKKTKKFLFLSNIVDFSQNLYFVLQAADVTSNGKMTTRRKSNKTSHFLSLLYITIMCNRHSLMTYAV